MVALIPVTKLMNPASQARKSESVDPLPSIVEHSALMIGNSMLLLDGIVHARTAGPPPEGEPKVPARNHTGPDWDEAQLAPVKSKSGLVGVGMEKTHCHHLALHCP